MIDNRDPIDELLTSYAEDWALERMPLVDRTVLRLGAYEILFCPDIPDAVAIDEAVELAKQLSTEESPGFVNGVLARSRRAGRSAGPVDDVAGASPTRSTLDRHPVGEKRCSQPRLDARGSPHTPRVQQREQPARRRVVQRASARMSSSRIESTRPL